MALRDRLEAAGKQDPRLSELSIAERNFRREGFTPIKDTIISSGLFELVREFVKLDPNSTVDIDNNLLPVVHWARDSHTYMLSFMLEDTILSVDVTKINHSASSDTVDKVKSSYEDISASELNKQTLEEALVDVLTTVGFIEFQIKIDYVERDPNGYYSVMGLHPNAFISLTDEEAEELIKKNYAMRARKHHPDRGGSEEMMKKLNNARDFFMNPENRK